MNAEEIRLFELIREYDPRLLSVCLESTILKMREMDESIILNDYVCVPVPGIIDDCCFRIRFRFPLFVLISPRISRFRMLIRYFKSSVGFLPVYIPAINDITLLKTWNRFADSMLGPASTLSHDYTCLKISKKEEMVELSSMNFILRNESDFDEESQKEIVNLIAMYFEFFYWNVPKRNLKDLDTMFYHNFFKIHYTFQVTKTIFIVDEIMEKEEIIIEQRNLRLHRASVRRLIHSSIGYRLEEIICYITEEITKTLEATRKAVIVGLFNTIKIGKIEHKVLCDPIYVIKNPADLTMSVIGLVAAERFDLTGKLSIGMMNEFEKEVYRTTMLFNDEKSLSNIENYRRGLFEDSIIRLYPVLLVDQYHQIYFLHPAFLGLLAHFNKYDLLWNRPLLLDLVNIIRYKRQEVRVPSKSGFWQPSLLPITRTLLLCCGTPKSAASFT